MPNRIQLSPVAAEIGLYQTLQLNIRVAGVDAPNPFTDARLIGVFVSPSQAEVSLQGFCDAVDGSVWRLRFCPVELGDYAFRLTYRERRGTEEAAGGFECSPSAAHGFLRIDPGHPYHFAHDDGAHLFIAGKTAWRLGCSPHWREFIDLAAAHRMNVLRAGVECAYFRELLGNDCWPWAGTREAPDFSRFALAEWQHWDEVLAYAFERGLLIEPCIFTGLKEAREARPIPDPEMERYWDYLLARWGAYPGVLLWELHNEFTGLPAYQAYMARYLHTHDPYRRMVTTSGHHVGEVPFPLADWNDLIVPHFCTGSWHHLKGFYHDWATKLHVYGKPVYVDETGRALESQSNTDGVHRRKQYWIWAMAGDYCNYHSEGGCFVELTLEPGEEYWPAYVNFWESTRWWEMVPADDRIIAQPEGDGGGSCLWSKDAAIVYLYTNRSSVGVEPNTVWLRLDGGRYIVRYYHPAKGAWEEGGALEHAGGPAALAFGAFRDDLIIDISQIKV